MKLETLERIIKSSNKTNVLNFPVGIDIYLLNPYRICNISPDGDWKSLGVKLQTDFTRFLAFSRINKIERTPIGNDEETILSNFYKQELNKLKANISKPQAKLVWKLFWLNDIENEYDKLPRDVDKIDISDLSNHSKAVIYHYLAINDTFNLFENPDYKVKTTYWQKALDFWAKTINDEIFWQGIEKIIEHEKANRNFELRNYNQDKLKLQLTTSIFNTLTYIPLKLIEQDFSESEKLQKNRSETVTKFIGLILKSELGDETLRFNTAKQLAENKISKDVSNEFTEVKFKAWADEGEYRMFYDKGMEYIDKIHEVTGLLKDESHDKNLHTSTFLEEVPKIPNLHQRVIGPLIAGIESTEVTRIEGVSRDIIDKTYFTQLILGLRILCELNIDLASRGKLLKNIGELNSRFGYAKIPYKSLEKINNDKLCLSEIVNREIFNKMYLSQYCYFLSCEFADPDASYYESYKSTKGIVLNTRYTFIPRSALAKGFHGSKVKTEELIEKLRSNKDSEEQKEKLERLKNQLPGLLEQEKQLKKDIDKYSEEKRTIVSSFSQQYAEVDQKAEQEAEDLKSGTDYLKKYRPLEIEIKKIDEDKNETIKKHAIEKKKVSIKRRNSIGNILLVLGVAYLLGSLLIFHFYGLIGMAILAFIGLYYIGDADVIKKNIKKDEKALKKALNVLENKKPPINRKIRLLGDELKVQAKNKFSEEYKKIEKAEQEQINILREKHMMNDIEYAFEDIDKNIGNLNQEIDSLTSALKNKSAVKKTSEKNNHPVVKILKGY